MNTREHARLAYERRIEMVHHLTFEGWRFARAAVEHGVTPTTARKWLGRFLAGGESALVHASSRPARSQRAIDPGKALPIVELRRRHMLQSQVARGLGGSESAVSRVLAGLSKPSNLRPVEPVQRYAVPLLKRPAAPSWACHGSPTSPTGLGRQPRRADFHTLERGLRGRFLMSSGRMHPTRERSSAHRHVAASGRKFSNSDRKMAIHHALSGELIDIQPLGEAIKATRTATLYKTQHLAVFRMILLAGKQMPEHHVVGEFTVQCLEGSVEFSIGTTRDIMRPGNLKCLAGGVPHSLVAIEDSSVLITLLLHGA